MVGWVGRGSPTSERHRGCCERFLTLLAAKESGEVDDDAPSARGRELQLGSVHVALELARLPADRVRRRRRRRRVTARRKVRVDDGALPAALTPRDDVAVYEGLEDGRNGRGCERRVLCVSGPTDAAPAPSPAPKNNILI